MDELIDTFVALWVIVALISAWYIVWDTISDWVINSPELRKCLSQSGTTWQWGECVIILNK